MIEEKGKVVEIDTQGVWVETIRQSACASCAARNGCGQKLLASVGEGKRFVFLVNNPENVQVAAEDTVVVGIQEGAFLKATLFMYLVPLLGLVVGALGADALGLSEIWMITSAFVLMAASFFFVRYASSPLFRSCQYQPTLIKVMHSHS